MGIINGNSFYELVSGSSWSEAESNSISIGGHLVTINDATESSWLTSNLTWNAPSNSSYGAYGHDGTIAYWIGLTDIDGNRTWADGTSVSYVNGTFFNDSEDYFTLGNNGHWNDLSDSTKSWFQMSNGIAEVPLSYFSISDLTITEGNSGNVTISRTGGTNSAQILSLVSSNGTANAGSDYTAINQTISFAAGESSKTVSISSIENTDAESSETFSLSLIASNSDTVPAQIINGRGTVTIEDDDISITKITNESSEFDQNIQGTNSDDILIGGDQNDVITSGDGSDVIDGNSGTDTVVYSGNFNDYSITNNIVDLQISKTTDLNNENTDSLDSCVCFDLCGAWSPVETWKNRKNTILCFLTPSRDLGAKDDGNALCGSPAAVLFH